MRLAIPLLRIFSTTRAEEFYCGGLGFTRRFAHRLDPAVPDPCYTGLERDGVWLHLSSFPGDGAAGGVANVVVVDVDALYSELTAKGVHVDDGHPVTQSWGTREMYVRDPDGNCLRFMSE